MQLTQCLLCPFVYFLAIGKPSIHGLDQVHDSFVIGLWFVGIHANLFRQFGSKHAQKDIVHCLAQRPMNIFVVGSSIWGWTRDKEGFVGLL